MIRKLFVEHPNEVGETYWKHMQCALCYGIKLVLVGLACLVHAFFPFLFTATASEFVASIYNSIKQRNPKYRG